MGGGGGGWAHVFVRVQFHNKKVARASIESRHKWLCIIFFFVSRQRFQRN